MNTFADVDISKIPLKPSDPRLFEGVRVGVFVCAGCNKKTETPMRRCGACLAVFYCSADCQERHRSQHTKRCRTAVSV